MRWTKQEVGAEVRELSSRWDEGLLEAHGEWEEPEPLKAEQLQSRWGWSWPVACMLGPGRLCPQAKGELENKQNKTNLTDIGRQLGKLASSLSQLALCEELVYSPLAGPHLRIGSESTLLVSDQKRMNIGASLVVRELQSKPQWDTTTH